ncbi:MarR family winged helix-turn-helix transcriptional regulator [Streptomyces sp. 7-21]|jgi:DNA-binding MarR family transcriptional regulator|uniref:MarR family winged helix-turn-helix transcriptional regulator n=1 Tax=Streptomyces sp. 7-21 TaxID=2802283 RepID=UPI00191E607B|nr:MarR family transcriptional regulator [Streptomyces sp. 7-21]MBL1067526.1 MarR family transcriptional regulator [Streptomyces sp. 7-21]
MPKTVLDTADDIAAVNELRTGVLRLARRLRQLRVDRTLSLAEMSAIGTLVRCGAMPLGELARAEHVQPPSMTRIIAVLQDRGLVQLQPHPQDRRQKLVAATDQAKAILKASQAQRNEWLSQLAGQLDEDEWASLRAAAPVLHKLAHL